jgi:acetyl/propionyl-CoA carboxylase alpha subunit
MIAKLAVWGADRAEAIERSLRALAEYRISGVSSTVGFSRTALSSAPFRSGDISTSFLADHFPDNNYDEFDSERSEIAAIAAAVTEYRRSEKVLAQMNESLNSQSNWKTLGRKRGLRK